MTDVGGAVNVSPCMELSNSILTVQTGACKYLATDIKYTALLYLHAHASCA